MESGICTEKAKRQRWHQAYAMESYGSLEYELLGENSWSPLLFVMQGCAYKLQCWKNINNYLLGNLESLTFHTSIQSHTWGTLIGRHTRQRWKRFKQKHLLACLLFIRQLLKDKESSGNRALTCSDSSIWASFLEIQNKNIKWGSILWTQVSYDINCLLL